MSFQYLRLPFYKTVPKKNLRILMLCDLAHTTQTVIDHIAAFKSNDDFNIVKVNPIVDRTMDVDLETFDVIIIHYSIFILSDYFLSKDWKKYLAKFDGLKVQIIHDEYRNVSQMIQEIKDLKIDVMSGSLSEANARSVYSKVLRNVTYVGTLPGYISESFYNHTNVKISDRHYDIVYRGRELPIYCGLHSQEKRNIGLLGKRLCEKFELKHDIEIDEKNRIYGLDWFKFLQSSKATLAVEGGVSTFDFKDNLEIKFKKIKQANPNQSDLILWKKYFSKYEGNVIHKVITPKIFETISLKTALIMYPGRYNNLLEKDLHFIELLPDGSNIKDVKDRLLDSKYLQKMVDHTHATIFSNFELTYGYYFENLARICRYYVKKRSRNTSSLFKRHLRVPF